MGRGRRILLLVAETEDCCTFQCQNGTQKAYEAYKKAAEKYFKDYRSRPEQ